MLKYNCNDYFQYLYRSCFNRGEVQFREERKKQIRGCNHEFILLKEGGWNNCGGFDSSDYVYEYNVIECVHCGVTNKYEELEKILREDQVSIFPKIKLSVETEEFNLIFNKPYSDKFDVNLISSQVVDSKHAKILYNVAKEIYPYASNEKIVDIMHMLSLLETNSEKMNLNTVGDAKDLIIRYCIFMNQVLTNYKQRDKDTPKLVKRMK